MENEEYVLDIECAQTLTAFEFAPESLRHLNRSCVTHPTQLLICDSVISASRKNMPNDLLGRRIRSLTIRCATYRENCKKKHRQFHVSPSHSDHIPSSAWLTRKPETWSTSPVSVRVADAIECEDVSAVVEGW